MDEKIQLLKTISQQRNSRSVFGNVIYEKAEKIRMHQINFDLVNCIDMFNISVRELMEAIQKRFE